MINNGSFSKNEKNIFDMKLFHEQGLSGVEAPKNAFCNKPDCVSGEPFLIDCEYDDGMDIPIAQYDAVKEFGVVADGVTDNTAALQSALNAAAENGGGTVWLESGKYAVYGTIELPRTVCLRGDWYSPNTARVGNGTVILAMGERNFESILFSLQRGSTLRNLTVFYPEQDPFAPKNTGAMAKCASGSNFNFENLTILGAWDGIICDERYNELFYLHNVYMYCYNIGFFNDMTSDIGRMDNVWCDPAFLAENCLLKYNHKQKNAIYEWSRSRSTALCFAYNDWGYQYNIFIRDHQCGIKFIHSRIASGDHMAMNGEFANVVIENCDTGIIIEQTKIAGIAFTNLKISSDVPARSAIETLAPYHGVSQFLNTSIKGLFRYPILCSGSSRENMPGSIKFVGLDISGYDSSVCYAVTVFGGSFTAQNVTFGEVRRHAYFSEYIYSASVLGYKTPDAADFVIVKGVEERIQLDDAKVECPMFDTALHRFKSDIPKPKSKKLYSVTDFGAFDEAEDNTEAFQKALDAAAETGGTVYIPGKAYKFRGHLTVPEGVELRGCWGGPFLTEQGGTYLLPYADFDTEDGKAFITLEKNSGLRGFSIFYPEQSYSGIVPFPWAVRGNGEGVWAICVDIANSYRGIDFASSICDNHYIDWVTGSPLKTGVFVGNSPSEGWVQNVHFNPNFGRSRFAGVSDFYKQFQLYECESIKIGDCDNEHIFHTFVYGSKYGLCFTAQQGSGARATVISHATDGSENGIAVLKAQMVEIINAQTTTMSSNRRKCNIVAEKEFDGVLLLFNCVGYGPPDTMEQLAIEGGRIFAVLYGFISGHGTIYINLSGGSLYMNSATFDRRERFIKIGENTVSAELYGNYCRPFKALMRVDENTSSAIVNEKLSWYA